MTGRDDRRIRTGHSPWIGSQPLSLPRRFDLARPFFPAAVPVYPLREDIMRRRTAVVAAILLAMTLGAVSWAGSETPPEGPPWIRDFAKAREAGIRQGKPIFVYLTKTY